MPLAVRQTACLSLLLLALLSFGSRAATAQTAIFDPAANYRILTFYGRDTEIDLSDYLASGVTGATFSLNSCDASRGDYYATVAVSGGKLKLTSNSLGHIHGTHTERETVCTVTGTVGGDADDRNFSLYTAASRTPPPLRGIELARARSDALDVRFLAPVGSTYAHLEWAKNGGG